MSVVPHERTEYPTTANPEKTAGAIRNILGNTAVRIAAGIAGAAATAAVAVGVHEMGQDNVHAADKPGVTHEINLDEVSADAFWSDEYTDQERVEWAVGKLHEPSKDPKYTTGTVEDAAFERLQDKLSRQGRSQLTELVDSSASNSAEEAEVQTIVAGAAAIYEDDENTSEKMLAASIDNESPLLDGARSNAKLKHTWSKDARLDDDFETVYVPNDAAATEAQGHDVEMASPISRHGVPIEDNGTIAVTPMPDVPTRVAMVYDSQNSSEFSENVQMFVGGHWVTGDVIWPSDAGRWIKPQHLVNIDVSDQHDK